MSTTESSSLFWQAALPNLALLTMKQRETVGRLLAQAGFVVQTGSYSGVMPGQPGRHVSGRAMCRCDWPKLSNFARCLQRVGQRGNQAPNPAERLLYLVDHCNGAIVMPAVFGRSRNWP